MDPSATPLRDLARRQPLLAGLSLILTLAAAGLTIRIGFFMADPTLTQHSLLPGNDFLKRHWCGSAYVRAAQLTAARVDNLYQDTNYGRAGRPAFLQGQSPALARLELDVYEYPPPFLLLPRLALALTTNAAHLRLGWFVLEAAFLAFAYLFVAAWVGGRAGAVLTLLLPLFWLSFAVLSVLQMGNFHAVMVGLCLLALVAFARGRPVAGGAMLAFAVAAKLSPGLLVVYLAARRQWRAVAWTAGFGAALCGLALLLFGPEPYRAFFQYHVPRLASGEAFDFIFGPEALAARPAPVAGNLSAYGLVFKLRQLGVPGMSVGVAKLASAVYLAAIVAVTIVIGRRRHEPRDRQRDVLLWLALLSLATFQAPFIPSGYGPLTIVWMLAVLACALPGRRTLLALAGLWLALWLTRSLLARGGLVGNLTGLTQQALIFALLAATLWREGFASRATSAGGSPRGRSFTSAMT